MAEQEPSGEQQSVGSAAPGPRLRALAWWRFGVAGMALAVMAALTLWSWGLAQRGDDMAGFALLFALLVDGILLPFFVLPLLWGWREAGKGLTVGFALLAFWVPLFLLPLCVLPSWFTAVRLPRRPRSAVWLALIQDLLVLFVSILVVISILLRPSGYQRSLAPHAWEPLALLRKSAPAVGLALAFGAEIGYLLRAVWKWRPVWAVFSLFAAALVSSVTVVPAALYARQARDVRPLLSYVNTHWIRIPPGARLALGQRSADLGKHTDDLVIPGQNASWYLSVEHSRDGHWTFPARREYVATLKGLPDPSSSGLVSGHQQAKALLARCGVVDTGLRPEGIILDPGVGRQYEFSSPLAGGHYRVNANGRAISFCLERSLEVP